MTLLVCTTAIYMIAVLLMVFTRRKVYSDSYISENPIRFIYEDPYKYWKIFYIIMIVLLIISEGFRYAFQDTPNYKGIYAEVPDDINLIKSTQSEWVGWGYVMWALRHINTHEQTIIIFCAVVFTICDFYFINKYSCDKPFALYLYFLMYFLSNCNGLRQGFASVMLMMAFPLLVKKKYILYIIVILLLSTVHQSILFMIPLAFLFGGKRMNIGLWVFLTFCIIFAIFPRPINALIGNYVIDRYASYIGSYETGANFLHVIVDAVPVVLVIIYHNQHKDDVGQNRAMDILMNMQVIKLGFMILATGMAQYARIGMYVRCSRVIAIPYLVNHVFGGKYSRPIKFIAGLLYFLVFVAECYSVSQGGSLGNFDVFYLDFSIFNS